MTTDRSPYFHNACETAPFCPGRMGERDLVSTESLTCRVNALEPGQRYEPPVEERADKLHTVLLGRGAFVIGDSRRVVGPGDVALAPAGMQHRVFANQGERLVLLVVTSRTPSPADVGPAAPESETRAEPAPAIAEPSPATAAFGPPEARSAQPLPGLTVPVMEEPAEAPPELPVARPTATPAWTPGETVSAGVTSTRDSSRFLDSLRSLRESSSAETPLALPETRRYAPRMSRLGAGESSRSESGSPAPATAGESGTGSDWLPDIFRMPARR